MNKQVLRALRMAKHALENTHGLWTHGGIGEGIDSKHHFKLNNSVLIREIAQAIEAMEQEHISREEAIRHLTDLGFPRKDAEKELGPDPELIVDTLDAAVAAGKEVLDSLVAALARAGKETLEEADARLDPAATEKRLEEPKAARYIRAYPSKPRCSMIYPSAEPYQCSQGAEFVVSGPCGFKCEKQYACDQHLQKTVNWVLERQDGVAHVEIV